MSIDFYSYLSHKKKAYATFPQPSFLVEEKILYEIILHHMNNNKYNIHYKNIKFML